MRLSLFVFLRRRDKIEYARIYRIKTRTTRCTYRKFISDHRVRDCPQRILLLCECICRTRIVNIYYARTMCVDLCFAGFFSYQFLISIPWQCNLFFYFVRYMFDIFQDLFVGLMRRLEVLKYFLKRFSPFNGLREFVTSNKPAKGNDK